LVGPERRFAATPSSVTGLRLGVTISQSQRAARALQLRARQTLGDEHARPRRAHAEGASMPPDHDHDPGKALRRVADELAIRNLLARVAQLADEGDLEDYLDPFTEDAVWGGAGLPERQGRAALRDAAAERRATGTAGPGTRTRHAVTTSPWTSGATSRSLFHFHGRTDAEPQLRMIGVWEDRLRRMDGVGKIAARRIVRDT